MPKFFFKDFLASAGLDEEVMWWSRFSPFAEYESEV